MRSGRSASRKIRRKRLFQRALLPTDAGGERREQQRVGKRSRLPVSIDPPRRSRAHLVFHPTSSPVAFSLCHEKEREREGRRGRMEKENRYIPVGGHYPRKTQRQKGDILSLYEICCRICWFPASVSTLYERSINTMESRLDSCLFHGTRKKEKEGEREVRARQEVVKRKYRQL